MTYQEKVLAVKAKAPGHHISGGDLKTGYWYGKNPYADMLIENALFCDMFPEEVPNKSNHYGFNRNIYYLSRSAI